MDWFTADSHFGHANIIKYSKRPFANVEEMDNVLIANINAKVKPSDRLYHLGDFAKYNVLQYRQRIKCKNITLIRGNHDKNDKTLVSCFTDMHNMLDLKFDIDGASKSIVLCHYALKVWNKSHYGSWNLYGHSHGGLPDDEYALQIDVGVDCHNYFPISLNEVAAIMAKKKWEAPHLKCGREGATWKPYDHHCPDKSKLNE